MPVLLSRILILLVAVCMAAPCAGQTTPPSPPAAAPVTLDSSPKSFDAARQRLAEIRKQLAAAATRDDAELLGFRDTTLAVGAQAEALVADRTPRLAAVEARLAELGPAPTEGGEARDIAVQRADLDKQRGALDAEIKRARLLSVDSQQLAAEISEARRASFQATLSERTASPLLPAFWRNLADGLARDRERLAGLGRGVGAALKDAVEPDNRAYAICGLLLGLLLLGGGRWWVERMLLRVGASRVPPGPLRRSALALAIVATTTLFTGLGARAIVAGLGWHGAFTDAELKLAQSIVAAVFYGAFVTGLGRALLSASRPSWRLLPMTNAVARRLRPLPTLFGCVVAFGILQQRVATLVGASLAATIAGSLLVALLYAGLVAFGLVRAARTAAKADQDTTERSIAARPGWIGALLALLWIAVIATFIAALFGYVALAQQIARQMMGLGVIAASFYLLVHVIEDALAAAACSRAPWLRQTLGLEQRAIDQAVVMGSGLLRVLAFALALMAALAPFGTEPAALFAQLGHAGAALRIGELKLTPGMVLGAVLVFVAGIIAIRLLQRWLLRRFLPTTRLEPAMASSVTTLLGYAGGVVVFALALSALGIGLERIAWVASALSVGIGFGLQAIVQNFVSGLILLVERPVKVGDWVVLGDTEGDIRRISVRATEIQVADRSTVIVPNSELITKSVRNVTLANAQGRVRLRLPLPLDADVELVRGVVTDAIASHRNLLQTPAPSVLLEGVEGASLILAAVAYVPSPRQAAAARSELLFDILARLRQCGMSLVSPYHVHMAAPPAAPAAAVP
ncbi:MAG: mechanosensitive ion channel family protein [Xanthomonadales bacterium]|nr:mechanosensitive ion channel family protein [Xanthomonadales bacterium]